MLKSRKVLILILFGLGCQAPAPPRVYVDFQAVLASYKSSPLPSRAVPKAPVALPAKTVSIPAVPSHTVVVEGASTAKGQALLEANRKRAIDELTPLLSKRYIREVDRASRKRIRELDPKKRAAYQAAVDAVQKEFEVYANKRAPLVVRLTSLVGFPDPNPNSIPPAASTPPFLVERLQEAASLRKQIAALDADYESKIQILLSNAGTQYDEELAVLQKQLDADRAAALKRAEAEAISEATKTYEDLKPILMGPTKIQLPGAPAQSAQLPAVSAPLQAPDVRQRALTADQRRSILQDQLDIWVKLNGYELVKDPKQGKDMTADFIKWREERKL